MNAGCFGKEFKDILCSVQVIDKLGNVRTIPSSNIKFEYRKNDLPEDLIFLVHRLKAQKVTLKIQSEMNRLKMKKKKINLQNNDFWKYF